VKYLVTGGNGFLGGALVRKLAENGAAVRSFSRRKNPELASLGVEVICGDLADLEAVGKAVNGCDLVYHVAAKTDMWTDYESIYRTNVIGTENVIEACRTHGVKYLIYTSSPSVTFAGDDQNGVDETIPYPDRYLAYYPQTKAIAEQTILTANSEDLLTVSLRPHLIWGPGDTHIIPQLVDRAKRGKLQLINGGKGLVDSVFIDNAVDAHILAASAFLKNEGAAACAGNAYFISNGEPIPIGELINRILAVNDIPPVTKTISTQSAYIVALLLETVYRILSLKQEPLLTRFIVKQLATSHWFDISAAERDLGYKPKVTIEEGLKKLRPYPTI